MMNPYRVLFAILAVFALALSASFAPSSRRPTRPKEDYVRAHYTKYEFRIPMRDGKRLFTAVYVPKDAAGGPYPFLMDRTPYSVAPYGEDQYPQPSGPLEEFEKSGYIFVYQDVRGRWMSEGDFVEMRPHIDEKKSPAGRGRLLRHLRHHRVSCSSTCPTTTARWASGESPIPASTPRRRSSTRTRPWWPPARRRP